MIGIPNSYILVFLGMCLVFTETVLPERDKYPLEWNLVNHKIGMSDSDETAKYYKVKRASDRSDFEQQSVDTAAVFSTKEKSRSLNESNFSEDHARNDFDVSGAKSSYPHHQLMEDRREDSRLSDQKIENSVRNLFGMVTDDVVEFETSMEATVESLSPEWRDEESPISFRFPWKRSATIDDQEPFEDSVDDFNENEAVDLNKKLREWEPKHFLRKSSFADGVPYGNNLPPYKPLVKDIREKYGYPGFNYHTNLSTEFFTTTWVPTRYTTKNVDPYVIVNVLDKHSKYSYYTCLEFERMVNATEVVAYCGDHFLFPNDFVTLMANTEPCRWRFRTSVPGFVMSFKNNQTQQPLRIKVQQKKVQSVLLEGQDTFLYFADVVVETEGEGDWKSAIGHVCSSVSQYPKKYEFPLRKKFTTSQGVRCGIALKEPVQGDSVVTADFFPWEVIVEVIYRWKGWQPVQQRRCSGSSISEKWVLTTSTCFLNVWEMSGDYKREVNVHFGVNSTHGYVYVYRALEVHLYDGFSDSVDIALVRLRGPFSITRHGRYIRSVCLPPYNPGHSDEDVANKEATVVGWTGDDFPQMLVKKRRIGRRESYSKLLGDKLPPGTLLTYGDTKSNISLSNGNVLHKDSGRYVLRGLTSLGAHCYRGVMRHTSVAHYMPWILETTGIRLE